MRQRKAYMFDSISYDAMGIIYAPNGNFARNLLYHYYARAHDDASFKDFLKERHRITRYESADVELPDRHEMVNSLTKEELHIITHSYGGKGIKAGYRNYYYTQTDDKIILGLVSKGIFKETDKYDTGMSYFRLTELGLEIAKGELDLYDSYIMERIKDTENE